MIIEKEEVEKLGELETQGADFAIVSFSKIRSYAHNVSLTGQSKPELNKDSTDRHANVDGWEFIGP